MKFGVQIECNGPTSPLLLVALDTRTYDHMRWIQYEFTVGITSRCFVDTGDLKIPHLISGNVFQPFLSYIEESHEIHKRFGDLVFNSH